MIAHVRLKKGDEVPAATRMRTSRSLTSSRAHCTFGWGPKGDREQTVRAGEVLVIPSNLEHRAGRAGRHARCRCVQTRPRQDWLNGTDAYLRR